MIRTLLRGIIRKELEKRDIQNPSRHISREHANLRGYKFIERGTGKSKRMIKVILNPEEKMTVFGGVR